MDLLGSDEDDFLDVSVSIEKVQKEFENISEIESSILPSPTSPEPIERGQWDILRKRKKEQFVKLDCEIFCEKKHKGKERKGKCEKRCQIDGGSILTKKLDKDYAKQKVVIDKIDTLASKIGVNMELYKTAISDGRPKEELFVKLAGFIFTSYRNGYFDKKKEKISISTPRDGIDEQTSKFPDIDMNNDPKIIKSIQDDLIEAYRVEIIAAFQYKKDAEFVVTKEIRDEFLEHEKEEMTHAKYIEELLNVVDHRLKFPKVEMFKRSGKDDKEMLKHK